MVFSRYARIPRTVPLKCAIGSPHISIAVIGTFTVKGVKYKKGKAYRLLSTELAKRTIVPTVG